MFCRQSHEQLDQLLKRECSRAHWHAAGWPAGTGALTTLWHGTRLTCTQRAGCVTPAAAIITAASLPSKSMSLLLPLTMTPSARVSSVTRIGSAGSAHAATHSSTEALLVLATKVQQCEQQAESLQGSHQAADKKVHFFCTAVLQLCNPYSSCCWSSCCCCCRNLLLPPPLLLLLTSQVLHSFVQHNIQQLIVTLEHPTNCSGHEDRAAQSE
jgi:hypothetical protein